MIEIFGIICLISIYLAYINRPIKHTFKDDPMNALDLYERSAKFYSGRRIGSKTSVTRSGGVVKTSTRWEGIKWF